MVFLKSAPPETATFNTLKIESIGEHWRALESQKIKRVDTFKRIVLPISMEIFLCRLPLFHR